MTEIKIALLVTYGSVLTAHTFFLHMNKLYIYFTLHSLASIKAATHINKHNQPNVVRIFDYDPSRYYSRSL